MRYLFLLIIVLSSFQVGLSTLAHAAVAVGSRPSNKKNTLLYSEKHILVQDSLYQQQVKLSKKPNKRGIGLILGGATLLILGFAFGVTLLLFFLFGFSIGQTFYFQDIYLTAGVMLTGLGIFGLGVFMISRGLERWRAYRKYRRAVKTYNN